MKKRKIWSFKRLQNIWRAKSSIDLRNKPTFKSSKK